MKIGVIADDFTGASDIALTLSEAGLRTVLVTGPGQMPDCEAAVIALKSRTAPVAQAVADSLSALKRLGPCDRVILKVCSTFDSTAEGNIGPVAEALGAALGVDRTVICPAFPEAGRRVFMGNLFVGDVPLDESGMRDHPLTPMRDADLRRVMAAQSTWRVGHLSWPVVRQGAVADAMDAPGHWIADAVEDADLVTLGQSGARLMVGGSGIALGLGRGSAPGGGWSSDGVSGPGAVLSGSCSQMTREQIARWSGPRREVTAEMAIGGQIGADDLAGWALAQSSAPLIYSSADPATVAAVQDRFGGARASEALESLFARTARTLVDRGLKRLVVAGGETSGAVVAALSPGALAVGPRLAPGVPILRTRDGLSLALKSGNFGGPDFFAHALEQMAQ